MKRLYTLIKRAWKGVCNKLPKEKQEIEGAVEFTSYLIAHKLPKDLEINVHDDVSVQEPYPLGIHRKGGQEESVRISASEGKTSSADVDSSGEVSYTIQGKSPQGESDTNQVCYILIEKINEECGTSWDSLVDLSTCEEHQEEGVDCRACDGDYKLDIQVTRVETRVWKDLAKHGIASDKSEVETIVNDIWDVIKKKSQPIPRQERKNLVLALNALETPAFAFQRVISAFRLKHGPKSKSLGFLSIWLVGPNKTLTHRLDES